MGGRWRSRGARRGLAMMVQIIAYLYANGNETLSPGGNYCKERVGRITEVTSLSMMRGGGIQGTSRGFGSRWELSKLKVRTAEQEW